MMTKAIASKHPILTATFSLAVLSLLSCNTSPKQAPKVVEPPAQSTVLQPFEIVLEGPLAVCKAPGIAGKVKIFIPKASHHFDPGMDADLNQTLLCKDDYAITLDNGSHRPGSMTPQKVVPPNSVDAMEYDNIRGECQPKGNVYATVIVDRPDEVIPTAPTKATIQPDGKGQKDYASKLVLRYSNVGEIAVESISKKSCQVTGTLLGVPVEPKEVTFPFNPVFVPGRERRLLLSMVPSRVDNILHSDAKGAYKTTVGMFGVKRTIKFPSSRDMGFGPHNDCRSPQVLVVPLEEANP